MNEEKIIVPFLLTDFELNQFCYTGVSTGYTEMFIKYVFEPFCMSFSKPQILEKDNRSYPFWQLPIITQMKTWLSFVKSVDSIDIVNKLDALFPSNSVRFFGYCAGGLLWSRYLIGSTKTELCDLIRRNKIQFKDSLLFSGLNFSLKVEKRYRVYKILCLEWFRQIPGIQLKKKLLKNNPCNKIFDIVRTCPLDGSICI